MRRNQLRPILGTLFAALPLLAALQAQQSLAATLVVTTTSSADAADGACSLREAIVAINNGANHRECSGSNYGVDDRIEFNIPGEGVRTILMSSNFPDITKPVTIDGLSQPGASCDAWPPTLQVELDGQGSVFRGLVLGAGSGGSLVRGLVIGGMANASDNFSAAIMVLSNGNRIECNYLGLRADGSTPNPNRRGIDINSASDNIIGTDGIQPALGRRNLISANLFGGINTRGFEPNRNIIAGNYIGVDASGTQARSNRIGVSINAASNSPGPALDNVIGFSGVGSPEFARNVISGNAGDTSAAGIDMQVNAQRTRIAGNYIGLSADGSAAIPNRNGISIGSNASVRDNLIGFPSAQPLAVSGNVISGNEFAGISINGFNGTDRSFIVGNLIGTFPSGAAGVPNGNYGIQLFADTRALVNGNVVSGHTEGIRLLGASGRTVPRFLNGEALPTGGDPLDSANNCITGNTAGVSLVLNGGTATAISFLQNWWGAANGPSGAGGGNGDSVSSGIGFDPFLTSAPAGCAVTPVADLQVVVQGVPSPLVAGTAFTATLGAFNAGPDPVAEASLRFTLPAGYAPEVPPLCALDAGQVVCPLGPIASGQTVAAPVSFELPPDASGNLLTTISVTSPTLDPNAGNNSQIINRSIVRRHDLRLALETDASAAEEGAPLEFRIRVSNDGPSAANAARVLLDLDPALSGLLWTCSGNGGGSCAAAGADAIDELVDLPVGSEAVFHGSAMVGWSDGVLVEAEILPAGGSEDPDPGNNADSLLLDVVPLPLEPFLFGDGFEPEPPQP